MIASHQYDENHNQLANQKQNEDHSNDVSHGINKNHFYVASPKSW